MLISKCFLILLIVLLNADLLSAQTSLPDLRFDGVKLGVEPLPPPPNKIDRSCEDVGTEFEKYYIRQQENVLRISRYIVDSAAIINSWQKQLRSFEGSHLQWPQLTLQPMKDLTDHLGATTSMIQDNTFNTDDYWNLLIDFSSDCGFSGETIDLMVNYSEEIVETISKFWETLDFISGKLDVLYKNSTYLESDSLQFLPKEHFLLLSTWAGSGEGSGSLLELNELLNYVVSEYYDKKYEKILMELGVNKSVERGIY